MTATLTLNFQDGQRLAVPLDHVVEIGVGKPSLEFSQNRAGKWTMRITTGLTLGRKLAKDFLTVSKNDD